MYRMFRSHLLLPVLTVLVQVAGVFAMRWQILSLFNPYRPLAPTRVLHTSYALLTAFGFLGAATALGGIYSLLRRARWKVAIPLMAFPCLPSLFLSMFYLYGILLFEGVV